MISVIIPTFDRPKKVVEAINSVLSQTLNDIEIIVVDDNGLGTTNQIETKKLIDSIGNKKIVYIPHKINKGGCAARNTGIVNAKGEYVAFLDDDDIWSKHFLEKMLLCFTNNKIGAVYSDFWSFDGKYSVTLRKPNSFEGQVFDELLKGWCPASTSLFVIKKDKIIEAGLFDENQKSFQDYDMWLRLSKVTRFAFCKDKLVIKYEGIGDQTSKNPDRRYTGFCSLVDKYNNLLSSDELKLFERARLSFLTDILYRRIVYKKSHKISYKDDKKEYYALTHSFKAKVQLFFKLHLSKHIYSFIGFVTLRLGKRFLVKKGIASLDF